MKRVFMAALAGTVVLVGSSLHAAAADARGRCHQSCVNVFQDCADQVAVRRGSMAACQRELDACQKTCR